MKTLDYSGYKVTIMGLGLNGGGLASALFFARRGAQVTVTDLRDAAILGPSLEKLNNFPIHFVLGRHEEKDFSQADLVVKNPAVRLDNPYLKLASKIETDLSLFLKAIDNPVYAVTGSKGKSSTATALYTIFHSQNPQARIGGNITVSPLSYLDELQPNAPVVLELSSWQLADLRGKDVLHPQSAVVTNLLWDHMNYYKTQEDYASDKAVAIESLSPEHWAFINADQTWGEWFKSKTSAKKASLSFGQKAAGNWSAQFWLDSQEKGWGITGTQEKVELLPENLQVPGNIFRMNCLTAAAMAWTAKVEISQIKSALKNFTGVEYRMEKFHTWNGRTFIDDTTATIPQAAVASFQSLSQPVNWIVGGTDKNLDLTPFETLSSPPKSIILLEGSATQRLIPILDSKGWSFYGPYSTMAQAVQLAIAKSQPNEIILLSPGAASFELFKNEFDRGNQFKQAARNQTEFN